MAKKYVPAGVFLTCDKGTLPAMLNVTFNAQTTVNGQNLATDKDMLPGVHIPPLGVCSITKVPCVFVPTPPWSPVKNDVQLGMGHPLLEDSKLTCGLSGRIGIHFSMAAAQAACAPPPPPEKSVFDQADDYLKSLGPLGDYGRFQLGVAEGVWEGGKGLVEGLWGLAKGGWNAVTHPVDTAKAIQDGVSSAYKWAGDSQNWANAAASAQQGISDAATWASNGENWQKVGEKMQSMSPRDWGKITGQVAFEVGLTAATAGAGTALNAAAKTSRVARMALRVAKVADVEGHAFSLATKAARTGIKATRTLAGKMKVLGKVVTGAKKGRRMAAAARKTRAALRKSPLGKKLKAVAAYIERKRKCLWDPIDVANGVMLFDHIDLELPGPLPFVWQRWWYSNSEHVGPLGHGWHHSFDLALLTDETSAAVRLADGRLALFALPNSPSQFPVFNRQERLELQLDEAGNYRLFSLEERRTYCFVEAPATSGGPQATTPAEKPYQLARIEDTSGFAIHLSYDPQGRLHRLIDSADRELRLHLDAHGRIAALEAPAASGDGHAMVVQYEYDAAGHLTAAVNALGQARRYAYRADHLMTRKTARTGVSFYFEYAGTGPQAQCVRTWGDGEVLSGQMRFAPGQTTAHGATPGDVSVYEHKDGLVTRHVDPLGAVRQWSYNIHGELIAERDPLGLTTSYDYDARGNQLKVTHPDGAIIQTHYNAQDLPVQLIDANGGVWQWTYDAAGHLLSSTDPLGAATHYAYDERGRLAALTDAAGQTTRLRYDAQHQLQHVVTPDDQLSSRAYDALGRLTQVTDAQGRTRRQRFDVLGRVAEVRDVDGTVQSFVYDAEDNVLEARSAERAVQLTYTPLNQVATRSEAGTQVRFGYDAEGRLTSLHNEHGEAYEFTLDAAGRVVSERGFDGLTRHYGRDAAGRVTHIERPAGRTTAYAYDQAGRVTEVTHNGEAHASYRYRADGTLLEARNAGAKVEFERDLLGRVLSERQNGHEVASRYDVQGQRLRLTSTLGADVQLERDAWGQVRRLQTNAWQSVIERDADGLEVYRQLSGGVRTAWRRDALGRPTSQLISAADGPLERRRRYQWQGADRLSDIDDTLLGATRYEYDAWGNLAAAHYADGTQELRQPDAVGNLFRTAERTDRQYRKGGRLREANGTRYRYDAEGNLVRKTRPDGKEWRYAWDGAGQLVRVTRPDGYAVTFSYDALGRRVSKRFRGKVTRWVWDGDVPLHEWSELEVGPGAGSTNDVITWLFEEESFAPVAKLTAQGSYSVITDHLGTPLELYDEQGGKTWQAQLDSYGGVRQGQGKAQNCPFRYQGQYEDVETGLYYNRFRYYDPESGSYISQDPIGLEGGSNLYSYVKDPLLWIDAFGLNQIFAKQGDIDEYGKLKNILGGGQAHHLNQNAAFQDIIPSDKGIAIKLRGNIFTQKRSNHYKAHKSLEGFWDQYRRHGAKFGTRPTNLEYTRALKESLKTTSLSASQVNAALRAAIKQRVEYNLLGGAEVPAIPRKLTC
jgi:RHS repeat-associated protein